MRWGIMATGTIAKKFADTVNAMNPQEESLVAVASRSKEKAEEFASEFSIPKFYGSYEEMLEDEEVEAVYIATPNSMHYENCKSCLRAGKHVLCEKPFTINVGQAKELYAEAKEKGLFLMEAFWIRFLPLYTKLQELISEKKIGELQHIKCDYGFVAAGERRERKFKSELGGGALLDIGIYNLGFLYMVTGAMPERFESTVEINEFGTDEYSRLVLHYPGGCVAESVQTIGTRLERNAIISGTKGKIFLEDFQHAEKMIVQLDGEEQEELEFPVEINGFEYEIREVSRGVAQGRWCSDIYTPQESMQLTKLMDEIRASWNMKFVGEAD